MDNDAFSCLKVPEPKPREETDTVRQLVTEILKRVEKEGETAVRYYMKKFDNWYPGSFKITEKEIKKAEEQLHPQLIKNIKFLHEQVKKFAIAQKEKLVDFEMETLPGVHIGQRYIPVDSVGAYIPGGRYTLIASAQMSIVPAEVAGVNRVVACTPPKGGQINPAVLYSIHLAGADEIYSLGGAQAIAAMAFGMDVLKPVDMIVGPGNKYVVEAKRQLYGRVGLDLLAGPTEILIIADETADPTLVAADLVGQCEHDVDSKAILITTSQEVGEKTLKEVERQLAELATAEVAKVSWQRNGEIILMNNYSEAAKIADKYAPEHLEVHTRNPEWFLKNLHNYGALFLGEYSTTAYSDKAVGPNHILPTGKSSRFTGGLWVGKFLKNVTYQYMTENGGSQVAEATVHISNAEGMIGHAKSVEIRISKSHARISK